MAFTHPHPAPGLGLWPETGFCSSGLPSHCSNDVWKRFKRREEGGREEASPDSPPSLPLLSTLQTHIFPMSVGGGKTPPAGAQGWMYVWAGIAPHIASPRHMTRLCPTRCFLSSCCPQQDTTQSQPTGVPIQPGPPVCPKLALKCQWLSSCKDNCGDSFVSSLLGALTHLGEVGHKTRTHTLTKPTPNLDQYQRELITGSCIFR